MKILRIYTRLPPCRGGMENHIYHLTKEQIRLGHDVSIFYNIGDKVSRKDVQITKLPLASLSPQFLGFFIFHFLIYLRLLINKQNFDLIHIHGDWSSLLFSKFIKKAVSADRLIFTVHDQISNKFFYRKLFSKLLKNVDILFATGIATANQLNKLTDKNVIVQPSGVNNIFLEDKIKSFLNNSIQVITVANLVKKKNLGLVLDIARELPNIKFIIVGEGPEKKSLLNRVDYEGLNNVQILGFKEPTELHSLYYESDIFMLTSLKEGTPTALLEAMTCGLPIVASDAGGVSRILGELNCINNSSDKQKYIDCISKFARSSELRRNVSQKNKIQSQEYAWKNVAKNIDEHISI